MGRNADELKKALKNIANKDVTGETKGEILENFNKQYADVALTLGVVDASGDDLTGATITLKKGITLGSGDAVTANADGTYTVHYGKYNYSIAKSGYYTRNGAIDITFDDVAAGAKALELAMTVAVVPAITTTTLPNATAGTAYSQTLAATGDTPITWALNTGSSLPSWATLSEAGVISGTPTEAAQAATFTVKATNAAGNDTQELSITVAAAD